MILILDDDPAVRTSLLMLLQKEKLSAFALESPEEARTFLRDNRPDLILLDMNFSVDTSGEEGLRFLEWVRRQDATVPVILITGWATIDLAVCGMKLGASDFLHKPWQNAHLVQSIRTVLDLARPSEELSTRKILDKSFDFQAIVGESEPMLRILETVGRVASTDASVLILGESGTGKELIAEAIHQNSQRARRPFVKVNLGGISASLFESELFGHVRGAFTDARFDRVGRFEVANKGTIFLDEIGDLDPSSQVKLLRVLQDRTFEVLGSSKTKSADVRVISATNRNLDEMVRTSAFREDLLYRINLITLRLPPLRERAEDIPRLVDFFLGNLRDIYSRPNLALTREALRWLKSQPLPGNIRQLKNLVERTVLVADRDVLDAADFQVNTQSGAHPATKDALPAVGSMTLDEMESEMIRKAMVFHQGKIARVARALGLTRSSLYRRLEKFGIPYEEQ